MWTQVEDRWRPRDARFEADDLDEERAVGPWAGHRRFVYDLLSFASPDRIVELGTHYGVSFFAMCQAIKDSNRSSELHAVDTWRGDPHAGFYGEDVLKLFESIADDRYAALDIRKHQQTFDEALAEFPDESIDLLHIDGFHSYAAAKHDFETWLPKLAPGGLVLLHDVAPTSGYGSAAFYEELEKLYPCFRFTHSFGLGVVSPKGQGSLALLGSDTFQTWRDYYAFRWEAELASIQLKDHVSMVQTRDAAIAAQAAMISERDAAIASQTELIVHRDAAIDAQAALVDERDMYIEGLEAQVSSSATAVLELTRHLEARDVEAQVLHADRVAAIEELRKSKLDLLHARRANDGLTRLVTELDRGLNDLREAAATSVIAEVTPNGGGQSRLRRSARRAVWRVRGEGPVDLASLLDEDWYRAAHPDVVRSGLTPREHYVHLGARENRQPSLLFDPAYYLQQNLDVAASGVPAAAHYLQHGFGELRSPHPLFDAPYYVNQLDGPIGTAPLTHFLEQGWTVGLDPHPLFDTSFYLAQNPDVAAAGVNPLVHFLVHGYREGRRPCAEFDPAWYVEHYPHVRAGQANPLIHYVSRGLQDGLLASAAHEAAVMDERPDITQAITPMPLARVQGLGVADRMLPVEALAHVDAELITFDIWDTLVARRRPADAAKLATARRIWLDPAITLDPEFDDPFGLMDLRVLTEARLAAEAAGGEYQIREVLAHTLRRAAPTLAPERVEQVAQRQAEAELADEIEHSYLVEPVAQVLRTLRQDGRQTCVISDFYMSGNDLTRLLHALGLDIPEAEVIVSSDLGISKARGKLLSHVRDARGVRPEAHLHVGDNPHSDFGVQVEAGGAAGLIQATWTVEPGPGLLSASTASTVFDRLASVLDVEANVALELIGHEGLLARASAAGTRTALLPVALVVASIEQAVRQGVDVVHYLSREGLFLQEIHEAVAPIVVAGAKAPRAVHLATSRRSTFGPALSSVTAPELSRMWSMYGDQSPRALLTSIGVDAEEFLEPLKRYDLELDQDVPGIATDDRIASFLEDIEVRQSLEDQLSEARVRLIDYLAAQTDLTASHLVLVDVGWRGTIQDNLSRVLPGIHTTGIYLGLFPFLNEQPDNTTKHGVAFDGNLGDDYSHVNPPAAIERPWTPDVPSTVGYDRGEDGAVRPRVEFGDVAQPGAIEAYQAAVLRTAPLVARFLMTNGLAPSALRSSLSEVLHKYFTEPVPGLSDLWFESDHDDTFGALNVTPFGKERPSLSWLHEGWSPAAAAESSYWSEGYLSWLPVRAALAMRALMSQRHKGSV
jgi:FMN phosphatase YigB (HAD superfamily)/predicted O-methyltransferase YrrM